MRAFTAAAEELGYTHASNNGTLEDNIYGLIADRLNKGFQAYLDYFSDEDEKAVYKSFLRGYFDRKAEEWIEEHVSKTDY